MIAVAVAVAAAAAAGTIIRWQAGRLNRPGRAAGTLMVNVGAAFALGVLSGSSSSTLTIAGVGFLGSLSTFSTVMHEVGDQSTLGGSRAAAGYLVTTVILGVAAAALGIELRRG